VQQTARYFAAHGTASGRPPWYVLQRATAQNCAYRRSRALQNNHADAVHVQHTVRRCCTGLSACCQHTTVKESMEESYAQHCCSCRAAALALRTLQKHQVRAHRCLHTHSAHTDAANNAHSTVHNVCHRPCCWYQHNGSAPASSIQHSGTAASMLIAYTQCKSDCYNCSCEVERVWIIPEVAIVRNSFAHHLSLAK
jgi:hypothetical protein